MSLEAAQRPHRTGLDDPSHVAFAKRQAGTMRSEFGEGINAHPGGVGIESWAINRAFRIASWVIRKEAASLEDGYGVQMWVMRQIALGRLEDLGVESTRAEWLLDQEPKLGEAWLALRALAPTTVIDDLMGRESGG